MADLKTLLVPIAPDWKAFSYALAGFLLNHFWAVFRNRRIPVAWTATFQRIVAGNQGPATLKLSIQLGDQPCTNLQSCQVRICNESGRDIDSINVLFTFSADFIIVDASGAITASAKNLLHSEGFAKTTGMVLGLPESERARNPSTPYILRNREFHLPALNRSESAAFNFWINSADSNAIPTVNTTTEKLGVKMVSRPVEMRMFDWKIVKRIIPLGLLISLLLTAVIGQMSLPPTTLAVLCFLAGASYSVFGLAIFAAGRRLKRLI